MITPLTITSLNQGKELARRQVERLYAEPAEAPLETQRPKVASQETSNDPAVRRSKWRSLFAEFIGFFEEGYPIGARRH